MTGRGNGHHRDGQRTRQGPSGPLERVRAWVLTHPLIALVLVAGVATAAITVTYSNTSDVTVSSVDPVVQYAAGDDAGPSTLGTYVSAYTISTNKTYFTSTVNGVPEAKLTVDSYVKLTNTDASNSHQITLTTAQVTDADVTAFTLKIYNSGDTLQDTLDFTAASPSATVTIPASGTFYATLDLTLASGTTASGLSSVSPSITLTLNS